MNDYSINNVTKIRELLNRLFLFTKEKKNDIFKTELRFPNGNVSCIYGIIVGFAHSKNIFESIS